MNTYATQRLMKVLLVAVLAGGVGGGLAGCAKWKERRAERRAARAAKAEPRALPPIVIDGHFNDWSGTAASIADPYSIYFRVAVQNYAPSDRFSLWLDVDDNAATGATLADVPEAAGMGIDLVIENLPMDAAMGSPDVYALAGDGTRTSLRADQIGLQSASDSMARALELRISRQIDPDVAPALAPLLRAPGSARTTIVLRDSTGRVIGWSDPETFTKP